MARSVRENTEAPAFAGTDQTGRKWSSYTLRGKWVVLYFYPKDETTGCTKEACGFRDAYAELQTEGAVVIGVSGDSQASHQRFAEHHGLPFPLLVDEDKRIMRSFGAKGWLGVARRVSFLIDPEGIVVKTYRVRRWREHAWDVLRDIQAQKRANSGHSRTKSEPSKDPI